MTSGFVSTKELTEEKQARQDAWEKVRKPTDAALAPEPEYCNKTLFEQLKDNKDAKQMEIDEAKKLKNMVRGIDDDESEFLANIDASKRVAKAQNRQEEQEVIKEMAVTQHLAANQSSQAARLSLKPSTSAPLGPPPKSKQATFLSTAIKRKSTFSSTDEKKEEDSGSQAKIVKSEPAMKQIGALQALCEYAPSSDSEDDDDSSDSDAPETLPILVTSRLEKSKQGGGCE